jgi:hypothetical protein
MGYFQYPTFYSVNCYGGDNKAAALSPGAAHDRRAASERYTESTDEIGSAARRGARSGWRPFMMNEAGVGTPSLPLFCLVFACAKNLSGKRPSIHYLLQGSIHPNSKSVFSGGRCVGGAVRAGSDGLTFLSLDQLLDTLDDVVASLIMK